MAISRLKVSYLGTNVGKIYLSDLGKRLGLGGAQEGNYTSGQDEYIIWGEIRTYDLTGDVISSLSSGILAHFTDATNASWSALNGPPLIAADGTGVSYSQRAEKPSVLFMTGVGTGGTGMGGTGLDYMWSTEYIARLANDKYAPATGVSGALRSGETGYYYGNSI